MKVMSVLFLCIGLLTCSLITGCGGSSAIDGNNSVSQARLIVVTINDSDESNRSQSLMEYEFLDGEPVSTRTILTNPGAQLRFNCDRSYLVRNRYVVTDFGDIVDISSGEFLHYGGSGSDYTRLVDIEGSNVIIHSPQSDRYFYYDLATQEYQELEDLVKWTLPGLLSPTETRASQV
ncbi:MAG: hypothetical protein U9N44_03405 [Chloroflexota bacterium]|nr:hypothetical protein [Chloroflexota bacterium]